MRWPTLASIVVHVGVIVALLVASFWRIEKVEAKYVPIVLGASLALPPPPPPPPPPAGGSQGKVKPRPRVPREVTQPVQVERRQIEEEIPAAKGGVAGGEDGGQEGGVVGGQKDGLPGGVLDGVLGSTGPAAPPPAEEAPRIVPSRVIEGSRIAGDPQIHLPDATKQVMAAQGIMNLDVVVKLCLSDGGVPSSIDLTKPSGFSELDQKIAREMRGWRYRPYQLDGKPVRVCTAIVFHYRLR